MKKPITKWVIVAILILFIAYSGFATYNWLDGERMKDRMLNDAIALSDIPLAELTAVGSVAESLIERDVTDELLRETTIQCLFHARTVFYSSIMLQVLTSDEKYGLFARAMSQLLGFFIEINNRPNGREILTTNLDALKQIEHMLLEIPLIDNLTLTGAEKLLEVSGNLTVG